MEDSTTMTIEFLRARLLSERSVSRTAKQRADELAKKVVELEEKLKTVTLQRKKAEKATVEVLAILENNGINDFSEAFDSNSDEDRVPCDSNEDTNSKKDGEGSVTSRRSNEAEEISVSELEGSPASGGGLSWKNSTNSKKSLEKKKSIDQSNMRECNLVFTKSSSTKPRVGKSCRQIKPREIKSAENEVRYESFLFDSQKDGGTIGMENGSKNVKDVSECTREGSENGNMLLEGSGSVEDEQKEVRAGLDHDGSKTHSDMQKAVENQAQLIDQNVAQENAQREWEENFKENDSCNPDSSEHGNQSDITEERGDIREAVEPADVISSHSQGAKSEGEEASIIDEEINKMPAHGSSSECTREGSENGNMLLEGSGSVEDEQKEVRAGLDHDGSKTHSDMQKAVENQAQLIDQNVAQENAQREWEENFKENDSCNLDSSEHGNQSDITEESGDIREAVEPADVISSHSQGAKSEGEEASIIDEEINKMPAHVSSSETPLAIVCSQYQHQNSTSVNEAGVGVSEFSFLSQENPGTMVKEKEKQEWQDTLSIGSSDYQSTKKLSFQTDGSQADGESAGNQNLLQLEVWQEPPKELDVVLEELQRAKLSLKHELNRSASLKQALPTVRMKETPIPAIEAGDTAKLPIGFAGLFRIPTDEQLVSATDANMFGSYSNPGLDLTRYSQNIGAHRSDPYRTSPKLEIGLRDSLQRPCFDPYMDVGMVLSASSKFTCPSYAELMPGDGIFRSFPSFRQEMPVNDRYSLYDENLASNIRHHRFH